MNCFRGLQEVGAHSWWGNLRLGQFGGIQFLYHSLGEALRVGLHKRSPLREVLSVVKEEKNRNLLA